MVQCSEGQTVYTNSVKAGYCVQQACFDGFCCVCCSTVTPEAPLQVDDA